MIKKIALSLTTFVLFALAFQLVGVVKSYASGLQIDWNNGCSQQNPAACTGNVAQVQITLTKTTGSPANVTLRKETYSCDFASSTNCGQNAIVAFENVTVQPASQVIRSLSRPTPQSNCGSAQVDFFVTDLATGVKTGPYWGFANTGKNCGPTFPACPPTPGADVNGKKPDVFYATGLHWIVGNPILQSGADAVYYLGGSTNPKGKDLQCYYPDTEGKKRIQTDWIEKNGLNLNWILVSNGGVFGLDLAPYWAKNLNF